MKTTLSDFGQDVQMPTIGQTYDIANQYKPSTSDVAGAFIEDAFEGVGSASYIKKFAEKEYADATESPLTKEAFEQSEYNIQGVDYYEGMTPGGLKILHDHQVEKEGREFIMSRASGGQMAAGFASGLGAGIFEPANIGLSLATAGIGSSVGFFKNMAKGASSIRKAVLVGAAESTAQSAIMAPVNIAMSKRMQDDYGAMDIFLDWSIGTTLGAGIDAGVAKIQSIRSNKMYNQISNASQKYGLDPNVMALISGYESSSVTKPNMKAYNKDTGAFGPFQFLPSTAKDYGIDRNSSYEEQLDAYMRFTKDNAAYVEKRIKRPLEGHEVYMAHWMGRGGAAAALKANPNEKAIDVFKKNGIYKGYEAKVLKQNRFDKDVTISGLVKGSKDRLNHHAKTIDPNYTPNNKNRIEEADYAVEQVRNSKPVNFEPLFAQRIEKEIDENIKKIDKIDIDYQTRLGKIELDVSEVKPLKNLSSNIDFDNIKMSDMPEVEKFSNIEPLNFDKKTLSNVVDAFNFYNSQRPNVSKYAEFQSEYKKRSDFLNQKIDNYIEYENEFKNVVAEMGGVSPELKAELQYNLADIQGLKQDTKNWLNTEKKKFNNLYNQAVKGQQEPLNNYLYDVQSIKQADEIADQIADTGDVVQANIEKYTADIEAYKEQGLIDKEMQDALDNIDKITIEEYNAIYKEAETCLLTLGGK